VVGAAASVGDIVVEEGAWSWTYFAADGPDSGQKVVIQVTDNGGDVGYGAFELAVANVPPDVGPISNVPVVAQIGWLLQATVVFTDPASVDLHTGVIDWGDGSVCNTNAGGDCSIDQGGGLNRSFTGLHTYSEPGLYTIALTVTDDDGASDASTFEVMVVYDPQFGSMTGGGWIDSPAGAYALDPSWSGRASFGFNVKYGKEAQVPKGETQFVLGGADLRFHSDSYKWMVITGGNSAQLAGSGTIKGRLAPDGSPYRFMLWAKDGGRGRGADTLRMKIWWGDPERVVYDNGIDQEIGGGSIVVHPKK
jgi:hypothetical protein